MATRADALLRLLVMSRAMLRGLTRFLVATALRRPFSHDTQAACEAGGSQPPPEL
jgi:hypothetical protein